MSAQAAAAVLVARDRPLARALLDAVGVQAPRLDPERVDAPLPGAVPAGDGLVWMHLAPATLEQRPELDEAALLLRSARAALRTATDAGTRLTFLALLPSRGLFTGHRGLACELARGAFDALLRTEVGAWSANGHRIAGVVYPGLEEHALSGQRPPEEVRRRTPIGALASVAQLADAVRYLGSSRASYVTGTLLHVDGGWNAYSWIYPARTI
jgi:hypothetical protein